MPGNLIGVVQLRRPFKEGIQMTAVTTEELVEPVKAKEKKPKRGRIESEQIKWGLIFISPWLVGITIFTIIPFVASFFFSLMDFNLANPEDAQFIGLANWQRARLSS